MRAPVTTRSLADLYLAQGHGKQARDAYESLLDRFPDDAALKHGLQKAQALVNEGKKADLGRLVAEWGSLARLAKDGGAQ